MFGADVKSIPHGFGAPTTAQRLHSAPSSDPGFQPTFKSLTHQCGGDGNGNGNGMMTDPYPHPQHMKVVKHLSYVWRGCVNHSMWVWSLKQCTRGSFSAKQRTKILDDFSNLEQQVWWVWHDDGSISPSTAYEGCQTPFICLERMWE